MANLAGMLRGGIQGLRDARVQERKYERDQNLATLRKQMEAEYEARIHKRNRKEELTDIDEERKFKREENEKDRAAKASAADKKEKPIIRTVKEQNELGEETERLVRVNDDGTMTYLELDNAPEEKMTYDKARDKAEAFYDTRASVWSKDETQFGMNEDDIIDRWAEEYMKYGRPITGLDKKGNGGMLKDSGRERPAKGTKTFPAPPGTKDGVYDWKGKKVSVRNGIATVISQ